MKESGLTVAFYVNKLSFFNESTLNWTILVIELD